MKRARQTAIFFWGAIVTLGIKLWLTSDIRIVPAWLPHDSENYVGHARSILTGHWFGPYSDLTLIKEPFFPIYLAFVHEIGLTVPPANELLYACACLLACVAIRPLVRNGFVLTGIFAFLLFQPMTYTELAWMATRSQINDSLALAAIACATAILVRRHRPLRTVLWWWFGLSVAFAAFWLTREEAIWLVPSLLVIAAVYAIAVRRNVDARGKLAVLLVPVAVCAGAQALIGEVNQQLYGWNTVVETKAPEFVSAYNSFVRIIPDREEPLVTVTRSAREMAYRVSPAARQLQPSLDGPVTNGWIAMVCKYPIHICNDFAGSFFMWAFRDAVAAAGHYTSGAEARRFYLQLASEIDHACDVGQLRCRRKGSTIFPDPTIGQIPAILSYVREGVAIVTSFSQFTINHPVVPINPLIDDEYAFVVGTISRETEEYQGWVATDRPMDLTVEDAAGTVQVLDGSLRMPSPDVAAALERGGRRGWDDRRARFIFAVSCPDACSLVATDRQKHRIAVPLNPQTTNLLGPHIFYHLDYVNVPNHTFDDGVKERALQAIARRYQLVTPPLAVLCVVLFLARIVRTVMRRRRTLPSVANVLVVAVTAGVGLLITILAALTVSYSADLNPEYVSSTEPLILFALSATIVFEACVAYRFVRTRARRRA